MNRYLANRLFFQTRLLSNTAVELDSDGRIARLFPLDQLQAEPAHTIFLPGTLTGPNQQSLDYGSTILCITHDGLCRQIAPNP